MAVEVVKTWYKSAVSEYECCVYNPHLHEEVESNSPRDDEKYIKRAPKLLCGASTNFSYYVGV